MSLLDQWMENAPQADFVSAAAVQNWLIINDFPTTISILREGALLPTQYVVRIEPYSIARGEEKDFQTGALQRSIIFGIKDHPNPAIIDTDLKPFDEVIDKDRHFEVLSIIDAPGEIQAVCEIRT